MKKFADMDRAELDEAIDAYARDDEAVAADPAVAEMLDCVAESYEDRASASNPPARVKEGREDAVLDVIMECAYPSESLSMSLSRLARAVGVMGHPFVTAWSARAAYRRFPHLSERPYVRKPHQGYNRS